MAIPWGAIIGAAGALGSGFLQGQGNNSGLEDSDQELLRGSWGENLGSLQLANQWKRYVQPYAQGMTSSLYSTIQDQLAGKGLPAGLENSIWQLARQRIGNNYNTLGNQLGEQAASRGTLRSGATGDNWLNQVGLARNTAEESLATERALANYTAMQNAINSGMSLLGSTGGAMNSGGSMPSYGTFMNQTPQTTDWGGLGSLFAKGLGSFGSGGGNTGSVAGKNPGTQGYGGLGSSGGFFKQF